MEAWLAKVPAAACAPAATSSALQNHSYLVTGPVRECSKQRQVGVQTRPYFAAATPAASDAAAFVLSRTLGSSCRQSQGELGSGRFLLFQRKRSDGGSETSRTIHMATLDLMQTQAVDSEASANAQPII